MFHQRSGSSRTFWPRGRNLALDRQKNARLPGAPPEKKTPIFLEPSPHRVCTVACTSCSAGRAPEHKLLICGSLGSLGAKEGGGQSVESDRKRRRHEVTTEGGWLAGKLWRGERVVHQLTWTGGRPCAQRRDRPGGVCGTARQGAHWAAG